MAEPLVAPSFVFRFSVPCLYREALWSAQGAGLGEEHRLPSFTTLDDGRLFADFRAAWSAAGLAFSVHVQNKRQPPWCRANRLEDSDGLRLWIDTRDTHNIHRAGRFCHHFVFLPTGGGHAMDLPIAEPMLINRARENTKPPRPGILKARSEKRIDGYRLDAFIPAEALTGFDPAEHVRLGFFYAVYDRELGVQPFALDNEFPYQEDPSLWGTLELVK